MAKQKPTLNQADFDAIKDLMKLTIEEDETLVRKEDISHLPTKEEFFKKMDKIVGDYDKFQQEKDILLPQLKQVKAKLGLV